MIPDIEIINYIQGQDRFEYIVKPYLIGEICHCTDEKNYKKIIKSGYIKYADKSTQCRGYKQKLVCLADYRDVSKDKFQLENIMDMLKNYIFILKREEHKNIIPSRTEEEYLQNKNDGYLIPEYECWYKNKIGLNKIEKIYQINITNMPQPSVKISTDRINEITKYLNL